MDIKMNLQGTWRFCLDEQNVGVDEKWYCRRLPDRIQVSGILQAQGYGNVVTEDTPLVDGLHDRLWFLREEMRDFGWDGKVRVPFLAQPARHYLGAAWYQREIEIPAEWEGRSLSLFMELVRWESTVWIDEVCIGSFDSLCVPHRYNLGQLQAGIHCLTVRVDNGMLYPYRPDAHGVSDSVGHSWNGIAGRVELTAENAVSIQKFAVYPDYRTKSADVRVSLLNVGKAAGCRLFVYKTVNCSAAVCLSAPQDEAGNAQSGPLPSEQVETVLDVTAADGSTDLEFSVSFGDGAKCWDEFTPELQKLRLLLLTEDGEMLDQRILRFGLRNIAVSGRKFLLNGRTVSFRGTHDAGCFPLTGYPPSDVEAWRKIFLVCREWGLNHVRFHSWCPPEAAFQAADEIGLYLQVETGMWNYFSRYNEIEEQLFLETDRILEAYGNHPSFVMLSSGNEPHGEYKLVVTRWVEKYRQEDSRRLYCAQSGWLWPQAPEDLHSTDYLYTCSRYNTSKMRGREGWFGRDYSSYMRDIEAPFLCHELGQYCSYPDFGQIEKFTGYLQPGNYECYRKLAEGHGLLERNEDFVKASGMLQFLAYKEEIEANLRTPEFSGFSLLDLHDYPGQGGALVGLLDVFWESKPYADAEEFRRFCSPMVALARIPKATYGTDEIFQAEVEIACYEKEDIEGACPYWQVTDREGKVYFRRDFGEMTLRTGGNTFLGKLAFSLSELPAPCCCYLSVGILTDRGPALTGSGDHFTERGKSSTEGGDYLAESGRTCTGAEDYLAESGRNSTGGGDYLAESGRICMGAEDHLAESGRSCTGAEDHLAESGRTCTGDRTLLTENRWKFWVYPAEADCTVPEGIRITETLAETVRALGEGQKVLFLPRAEEIHYNSPLLSSLPVFWNGRMGPKWCRGLGMWCDSAHKALQEFPTESGMEWQWSEIVEGARGMNIEGLPGEIQPFLCPIDDWNRSYRLALAFEAELCGGKLLVCSADLLGDHEHRPAARQLLHSFLKYMDSADFAPKVSVTENQLKTFLADTTIMRRTGAKVRITEGYDPGRIMYEIAGKKTPAAKAAASNPVERLIDGDPNTFWLAGGAYGGSYPFTLEFETPEPVSVKGLLILPRQNHRDWEGQVKSYEVYVIKNGQWDKLCEGKLGASPDAKEILFPERITLTRLRLRLLEGFSARNTGYWDRKADIGFCFVQGEYVDSSVSIAEVDFLCDDFSEGKPLRVTYREGKTDSEEIY